MAALLTGELAWQSSAELSLAAGYNDNRLLSHTSEEASGFLRGSAEALAWHVPKARIDYFAFLKAEGRKYFSGESVRHEAQAFAQVEWRYRLKDRFSFALDAQGYYLDQLFDVSDTDLARLVAELQVTGLKVGPTVRWVFLPPFWVEGSATGTRETFRDGINNAQLTEAEVRVGWDLSDRIELSAFGATRRRAFDRHPKYDGAGRATAGVLTIREDEAQGRLTIEWGARRHWKTITRMGGLRYRDNGSGYLNYHDHYVRQEIEWHAGDWTVYVDGEAKRKSYDLQKVGLGVEYQQIKDEFAATARVERKLSDRWTVFAEYNWDRNRSNYDVASYRMNEGLLGARWSWEK